jgi:uroporphyrinogen III methyltransferase/synthase
MTDPYFVAVAFWVGKGESGGFNDCCMKKTKELKRGVCHLVGAGPGDPGLFTLRGKQLLERAEVVVYDYLSNPELLRYAPAAAERIYVGKKAGAHTLRQEEINALLVEKTAAGFFVVRLKGGDPFLFGRGGEEAEALAEAGLAFTIVPGVTSAIGGPAYAGIPVTHREHNGMLTIFTGHEEPGKVESSVDYAALARSPGTKVMLMGVERLEVITTALMREGMPSDCPVALVRWASTPRQETLVSTVGKVAEEARRQNFKAPAVAVFGPVAGLREKLRWFDERPLFGVRIAVTRTRQQAGELVEELRELGADAFELPTIRIEPAPDRRQFLETVAYAHQYDWLIFTSPNGVDAFFAGFYELYSDARSLGSVRIAAIGPATAARVRHFRFNVDVQPEKYIAEEVVAALQKETSVENLQFLLPHAEKARDVIPEQLTKLGAIVDVCTAYRTVPETEDVCGGMKRFREEGADFVTFTSSSTAENFHALGLPWPENCRTISIGPVTSKTLRELGYAVDLEAATHDIPGLVAALRKQCSGKKRSRS